MKITSIIASLKTPDSHDLLTIGVKTVGVKPMANEERLKHRHLHLEADAVLASHLSFVGKIRCRAEFPWPLTTTPLQAGHVSAVRYEMSRQKP